MLGYWGRWREARAMVRTLSRRRFLATALLHVFTRLPHTDCGGYW